MSIETLETVVGLDRPELTLCPGEPLPLFAKRDGEQVVVLSMAAYGELLALRAQAARLAIQGAKAPPAGLSTIEKDVEVAEFLRQRFRGRETGETLRTACVEAFGADRAPSVGRIQTFRSRWRAYR